jgi:hypothetical protein
VSDWAIWAGLGVGLLAALAALVFLAVRLLQAWRDFKRVRRHIFKALDLLAEKGERTAELAAAAGDTDGLEQSLGRLRASLARLAVLREALAEAQETFGRVTAFVPRK